jgi:hypothetical protein
MVFLTRRGEGSEEGEEGFLKKDSVKLCVLCDFVVKKTTNDSLKNMVVGTEYILRP